MIFAFFVQFDAAPAPSADKSLSHNSRAARNFSRHEVLRLNEYPISNINIQVESICILKSETGCVEHATSNGERKKGHRLIDMSRLGSLQIHPPRTILHADLQNQAAFAIIIIWKISTELQS